MRWTPSKVEFGLREVKTILPMEQGKKIEKLSNYRLKSFIERCRKAPAATDDSKGKRARRDEKIIEAKAGWMLKSRFIEQTAPPSDSRHIVVVVAVVCCCVFPHESSASLGRWCVCRQTLWERKISCLDRENVFPSSHERNEKEVWRGKDFLLGCIIAMMTCDVHEASTKNSPSPNALFATWKFTHAFSFPFPQLTQLIPNQKRNNSNPSHIK